MPTLHQKKFGMQKNKLKIIKIKKTIITKKNKITKKNIKAIITSKETNKTIKHFLKSYKECKLFKMSSSLKFCFLAEKKADIYILGFQLSTNGI